MGFVLFRVHWIGLKRKEFWYQKPLALEDLLYLSRAFHLKRIPIWNIPFLFVDRLKAESHICNGWVCPFQRRIIPPALDVDRAISSFVLRERFESHFFHVVSRAVSSVLVEVEAMFRASARFRRRPTIRNQTSRIL